MTYLLWQACQTASSHTHQREEGRRRNFSSCSDHSWIKTTAIFSSLTFEFEYFFFCRLLSLQHTTLVLWYTWSVGTQQNNLLSIKHNRKKYFRKIRNKDFFEKWKYLHLKIFQPLSLEINKWLNIIFSLFRK